MFHKSDKISNKDQGLFHNLYRERLSVLLVGRFEGVVVVDSSLAVEVVDSNLVVAVVDSNLAVAEAADSNLAVVGAAESVVAVVPVAVVAVVAEVAVPAAGVEKEVFEQEPLGEEGLGFFQLQERK